MKAPASINSDTFAEAVVAQIKAERAALDLPVGELARRAGVSHRAISRYLNGERELTLRLVENLAHALDLDLATILSRAAERQSHSHGGHPERGGDGLDGAEGDTA